MDEQHPSPRSEEDAQSLPAAGQLDAEAGEVSERAQARANSVARVDGQAERADEVVEVLDGCAGELDARQPSELVEADGRT